MKKLLRFLTIALVAGACTCHAVDYNNHFNNNQRVYRVALGSGNAPSAADMNTVYIRNGDMVLNTDDDCLYIMHATNVYTKMTSAGTVTLAAMSVPLASNKVYVGNASGVANEKTLSGLFSITTGGVASATTTGSAYTNATVAVAITPQAPSAHTPTITVTKQTGAVTASGANNLVTPTAIITPQTVTPTATPTLQTGAITASGANNLVTPTITVTIQTATGYDSTGAAITNAAGESMLLMTNATATCSPDLASNAVVVVSVTGGGAVMTNLSIAVTPDLMTNATCAITPDLSSNSVVAVSITGGSAVMTNATAESSALPVFATNATAVATVTPQTTTFVKP